MRAANRKHCGPLFLAKLSNAACVIHLDVFAASPVLQIFKTVVIRNAIKMKYFHVRGTRSYKRFKNKLMNQA